MSDSGMRVHPRISRRSRIKRERSTIDRRAAHPGYY